MALDGMEGSALNVSSSTHATDRGEGALSASIHLSPPDCECSCCSTSPPCKAAPWKCEPKVTLPSFRLLFVREVTTAPPRSRNSRGDSNVN